MEKCISNNQIWTFVCSKASMDLMQPRLFFTCFVILQVEEIAFFEISSGCKSIDVCIASGKKREPYVSKHKILQVSCYFHSPTLITWQFWFFLLTWLSRKENLCSELFAKELCTCILKHWAHSMRDICLLFFLYRAVCVWVYEWGIVNAKGKLSNKRF